MGLGLIIQRRSHIPRGGVAGMLRNRWPEWIGMAGRNGPEWVAGINRNQWPECVGIRSLMFYMLGIVNCLGKKILRSLP